MDQGILDITILPWITALSWQRGLHNLIKLWAHALQGHQDRWVIVKSSDKMWSTGRGNDKSFQHSCHEKPMNSMERQKDRTLKICHPGWKMSNMLLGKSRGQVLVTPERLKWLGQSRNDTQLWMCLVVKVQSNPVKNNIAYKTGMLGQWIKVNWTWSSRRWQEWVSAS